MLTLLVVAALIVVFFWFSGFYADVLWYDQLGYLQVLLTQWGATAVMFLIGLVGMAERAKLVGGTFDAGPSDGGGWRVEATLPRRAVTR